MKVSVLASPPVSGSVVEHWIEPGGDAWFQFETDDGSEWAGLFRDGKLIPERASVDYGDGRTALVNAGGTAYVVDVPDAALLYKPSLAPLVEAIPVPERGFVIARDFTSLHALGREAELWRSDRVASDGLEFRRTTSNALHGRVWRHEGWHNFTLAYDGWLFSLGDRLPER